LKSTDTSSDEFSDDNQREYAAQKDLYTASGRAIQKSRGGIRRDPKERYLFTLSPTRGTKDMNVRSLGLTHPLYAQSQLLDIARWQRFAILPRNSVDRELST
jgi:hypothetical protein